MEDAGPQLDAERRRARDDSLTESRAIPCQIGPVGLVRKQLTLLLVTLMGSCGGRPLEIGLPDAGNGRDGSPPDARIGPSWPVPAQRNARSLRSEGPHLYWLANESSQNVIRRCAKRDCGGTQEEIMQTGGDRALMGFEIRGEALYSVAEDRIMSCSLGACRAPKVLVSDVEPLAVAFDDERVYWSERSSATIFTCPLTGCTEAPTVVATGIVVLELLADRWRLYGIVAESQLPGTPVSVVSGPKDGSGEMTVLAARQNHAAALTVTDGFAYWSTSSASGAVARCPVAGCANDEPEILSQGQYYPHFVNPLGDSIFWMNGPSAPDSAPSLDRPVQIISCRIATCASSRDVLEDGKGGGFGVRARATHGSFEAFALPAREMVVDAEAVYWFGDIVDAAPSGPRGAHTDASLRRTERALAP